MTDETLDGLAREVGVLLKSRGLLLTTAESCTGGWVAQAITAISGSSKWFERGFVTYSDLAKHEMLGVQDETLAEHGAVSEPVVREMALGALAHSRAQIALAVSGVAGPEGGSAAKPVGTVCFAWAEKNEGVVTETRCLDGDREAVRRQATRHALAGILERLAEVDRMR